MLLQFAAPVWLHSSLQKENIQLTDAVDLFVFNTSKRRSSFLDAERGDGDWHLAQPPTFELTLPVRLKSIGPSPSAAKFLSLGIDLKRNRE
jgi:hypothetical protein